MAAGYGLLAAGCWLLAVYSLQSTVYSLPAAGCWLLAAVWLRVCDLPSLDDGQPLLLDHRQRTPASVDKILKKYARAVADGLPLLWESRWFWLGSTQIFGIYQNMRIDFKFGIPTQA
jgi:hypothetical protein